MSSILSKSVALKNDKYITIRTGEIADATPFLDYLAVILEDGEGMVLDNGELPRSVKEQEKWVGDMLDNPNELLLVAEHDSKIVGNIDFHIAKRRRLRHGGIIGMAVLPEWREFGVGTALMGSFMEWVQSRVEIERISLYVLANNTRAIALYRKFGFVEEGRQIKEVKLGPNSYIDNVMMGQFIDRS